MFSMTTREKKRATQPCQDLEKLKGNCQAKARGEKTEPHSLEDTSR
jgi:hypothetical protein